MGAEGKFPWWYMSVSYTHLDVYKRQVCELCQKSKVVNYRLEGELNYIKVAKPFDLVAVDLYGPLPKGRGGVMHIFVVLDAFSKYVRLYSCLLYTSRCV